MTDEELEKEAYQYDADHLRDNGTRWYHNVTVREAYLAGAEPREKRIAELEEKISVLLSCKNCPENKGGYICEKEYENKCLAQKIQFIKELQEEIAELEAQIEKLINFVLSKTECCDVCPATDTCINSEGSCPYAGILAKGEEEVTRKWLIRFIKRR